MHKKRKLETEEVALEEKIYIHISISVYFSISGLRGKAENKFHRRGARALVNIDFITK